MGNITAENLLKELNDNMTMEVLPVTIFIGVECLTGLIGNILIIIIYYRWYKRSNFRVFVLGLAVIDLTSCLTTLPGEIFSQTNWYTYWLAWPCKVKSYFNVWTALSSAIVLTLMSVDRNRKILKPLSRQIEPPIALKLTISGYVLSTLLASPILILWGKQTYAYKHKSGVHFNVSICEKSEEYANEIYPLVYIGCVYILPVGVMLIVVGAMNVRTAKHLFWDSKKSGINACTVSRCSSSTLSRSTSFDSFYGSTSISSGLSTVGRPVFYIAANVSLYHSTGHLPQEFSDDITSTIKHGHMHSSRSAESIRMFETYTKSSGNYTHRNGSQSRQTTRQISDSLSIRTKAVRAKRKTIIMIILTSVYIITMAMYVILTSFVAGTTGVLRELSESKKVVFFFFWRLYFINCAINPIVYGILDSRFRTGLIRLFNRKQKE